LYATRIFVRRINETKCIERLQQLSKFRILYQQLVKDEIDNYVEYSQLKKTKKIIKIFNLMNKYYDQIKVEAQIDTLLEKPPNHSKTENAFEILRPKSPYTFNELTSRYFNPKIRHKNSYLK